MKQQKLAYFKNGKGAILSEHAYAMGSVSITVFTQSHFVEGNYVPTEMVSHTFTKDEFRDIITQFQAFITEG